MMTHESLGVGVGWRRELALWIDRSTDFRFVEVMAEDFSRGFVPPAVRSLRERGLTVAPHSVSLSLAGADLPDPARLAALGQLGLQLGAPVVSDHIAFVRSGGRESGHLLPPPRTEEALSVLVENVRSAQQALPVPLALENIATLFEWPRADMDEATFVAELLHRTGARLLLDVSNLYANSVNHGWGWRAFLDAMPLERLAYVHIAGGAEYDGLYHDTHAHPLPRGPLEVLGDLAERAEIPAVLLERDDRFPPAAELEREVASIRHWSRDGRRFDAP